MRNTASDCLVPRRTGMMGERCCPVTTSDGPTLDVHIAGAHDDVDLTVVFMHGYCLNMRSWRPMLAVCKTAWPSRTRIVTYDQRGHGSSEEADPHSYTLDRIADDLHEVLAAVAPTGPVMLVGHSMGGMGLLAYAQRHRRELDERVAAAALLSTAPSGLTTAGFASGANRPFLAACGAALALMPNQTEKLLPTVTTTLRPAIRWITYGRRPVPRRETNVSARMLGDTPFATIAGFFAALREHDQAKGLTALGHIPTLIACGDKDLATPWKTAQKMAASLPDARLLLAPGAGHMAHVEQPRRIADSVLQLAHKAATARPIPVSASAAATAV
ncbi:MAG: alpha/beta hydrolase [Tomitella sp.]|nr:alpha/beta hydrolase [Tomitella sp.]